MVTIRFILLFILPLVVAVCVAITTLITKQQHCSIDPIVRIPWIIESQSLLSFVTCDVFSDTYDIARQKFRAAVNALQPNTYHFVSLPIHSTTTTGRTKYQPLNSSSNHNDGNYTIDVVVLHGNCDGDYDNGIVIHISGTHGVEGFAGSAIQIGYLHGFAQQQQQQQQQNHLENTSTSRNTKNENSTYAYACRSTVILIHAFNPFGMKHYRRVNEHNVDLNRNGLVTEDDWDKVLNKKHYNTQNYDTLVAQHLLSSSSSSKSRDDWSFTFCGIGYVWLERYVYSWVRMTLALMRYGIPTLKAALVGGQYHVRDGLFYGGGNHNFERHENVQKIRNEPSLSVVREWLENFFMERSRSRFLFHSDEIKKLSYHNDAVDDECVTWIDVHTGLGPMGIDTLLFGTLMHPPAPMHLKHWFPTSLVSSSSIVKNGTGTYEHKANEDSTTADAVQQGYERVVGYTMDYYYTTLFDKHYSNRHNLFMVQEFGTVPSVLTGRALIVEHLIHNYYSQNSSSNTDELLIQSSKDVLGAAFYPQRTVWRHNILRRGIHTLQQAIRRSSHYSRRRTQNDPVQNGEHNSTNPKDATTKHANNVDGTYKVEL